MIKDPISVIRTDKLVYIGSQTDKWTIGTEKNIKQPFTDSVEYCYITGIQYQDSHGKGIFFCCTHLSWTISFPIEKRNWNSYPTGYIKISSPSKSELSE